MRIMLLVVFLVASAPLLAHAGEQPVCALAQRSQADKASERPPLASWNDGKIRNQIIDFVEKTTRPGSPSFVPEKARIAVFDNDGTLWSEKPIYVQLAFVLDRIRVLSAQHPEWRRQEPFRSAIKGDMKTLLAAGEHALIELVNRTHAGMTNEQFSEIVSQWIKSARHPVSGCLYTQMIYQPMFELVHYLQGHGYRVFIVSGGGAEFMRVWADDVYNIPPERVIGSTIAMRYETVNGTPQLIRLPKIDSNNDKAGKPVSIQRHIGQRPVIAVGNSDGDLEMLAWTTAGQGERLGLLLHHTDAVREEAYDRHSPVGRLDKALDKAPSAGWLVIDMKNDWKDVFSIR